MKTLPDVNVYYGTCMLSFCLVSTLSGATQEMRTNKATQNKKINKQGQLNINRDGNKMDSEMLIAKLWRKKKTTVSLYLFQDLKALLALLKRYPSIAIPFSVSTLYSSFVSSVEKSLNNK